jgi:hypothetical protein
MLRLGITVVDPTLLCAVVMAANAEDAAPGPVAITSPVKDVMAEVVADEIAAVESEVTRPLASILKTGTTVEDPTLLCAVVMAASVGPG